MSSISHGAQTYLRTPVLSSLPAAMLETPLPCLAWPCQESISPGTAS